MLTLFFHLLESIEWLQICRWLQHDLLVEIYVIFEPYFFGVKNFKSFFLGGPLYPSKICNLDSENPYSCLDVFLKY